jgi:SNF2 family DNA or RNA helicase
VGTLHPFQAEGVPFLVANQRALLADDMGLGKTVQALAALGEVGTWPAVIVAPPNVLFQWERMIGAFLDGGPRVHRVRGLTAYDLPEAEIYLIHYGLLRGWGEVLRATGLKTVIFAEVQELRHTGTQKYSEASLLAGEARNCWGLSGTPIYNYGGEIWAVMNILEYHCLGDFDSFTREWGTGYQSLTVAKPEVLGDYLRREGLMLRRRKSEVMDQLPPKRRSVIPIDHDQNEYVKLAGRAIEQARSYSSITDWHEKGLVKRQIEGAARQATGVAKAQWASQFIGSLILAGERPLIFAHHHAVHDILHRWLNSVSQVSIATGKQTQDQKDAAIRAFAEGHVKGIQLGLRTTAGLDGLQGMGTCVVFCELDWSPAVHAQCEDRLQRMGVDCARESIMCYYLVAATGSDETMQGALGLKIGQFVGIMGDKGEGAEDKALAAAATERHLGTLIERLAGENRTDQCEMKETHRK